MKTFPMSLREVNQISVFERLVSKNLKQKEAAKMLNLSVRQIRKKLRKFRELGPISLIHALRGRPANNQLDKRLVVQAISLVKEKYPDFGPTFASEKLWENHQLQINRESLRLKMIEADLWRPRARKIKHRAWRERKECLGELVQLDGSPHPWFEDRAPSCTLIAFIDDATSRLLHLEFADEATIPLMKATKRYIEKQGLPQELYVDRGKVFKVNIHNEEEDKITQYRRAIEELGIGVSYARSPQAKGRIERLFETLQDRLIKELRLRGISTKEEANRFIEEEYLSKHNERYAVTAKSSANLHRQIQGIDLNEIFVIKDKRVLNADFTLRFNNQWFQLGEKQRTLIFPKNEITITTYLDGQIKLAIRNTQLNYRPIDKPIVQKKEPIKRRIKTMPWKPPADHPWRRLAINNQNQKAELSTLLKAELSTLA